MNAVESFHRCFVWDRDRGEPKKERWAKPSRRQLKAEGFLIKVAVRFKIWHLDADGNRSNIK